MTVEMCISGEQMDDFINLKQSMCDLIKCSYADTKEFAHFSVESFKLTLCSLKFF